MFLVLVTISLIVFGLIPSLAWLLFYLHEDYRHPEPKSLVMFTFLLGGLITFALLPIQISISRKLMDIGFDRYGFDSFLVLAFTEELFKFLVVYVFIHKRREFKEPVDAMLYMIFAALGFAAVENIASLFNVSDGSIFNIAILESISLRFIGATLLHTLASGTVGYFWGLAFLKSGKTFFLQHGKELPLIATGLLVGTILHAIFNKLIILTGPASLAIIFVVLVAFFVLNDFEKFKKLEVI
jgi:protease PrsW